MSKRSLAITLRFTDKRNPPDVGGSGCSSTFRPKPEKVVADGGDGGDGGDVIILADARCEATLKTGTKERFRGSPGAFDKSD